MMTSAINHVVTNITVMQAMPEEKRDMLYA